MAEQETAGNRGGDPEDAAKNIVDEIAPIGHFCGAGDGWTEGADDGGETGEDDGAAAILFIEVVGALQMVATEEERVFTFVKSGAGRAADPITELIANDGAGNDRKQPMKREGREGNSGGRGEDTGGNEEGIAGQKEADEKASFDEDDATDESGTAGADEFFQTFGVEERADEVDKGFEQAVWFLKCAANEAASLDACAK